MRGSFHPFLLLLIKNMDSVSFEGFGPASRFLF